MSVPDPRTHLRAWFDIGTQSFGGGTGTIFMMRRVLVEKHAWITQREFTEAWAFSQLSPGIHIVALAGILGRRIAGPGGIAVAVAALMVPAALITAGITAVFGSIADAPLTRAALDGVGPVAAGMTLGLAVTIVRPILQRWPLAILDVAVVGLSAGLLLSGIAGTLVVILAFGAFGALFLGRGRPTAEDAPMS